MKFVDWFIADNQCLWCFVSEEIMVSKLVLGCVFEYICSKPSINNFSVKQSQSFFSFQGGG